MSFCIFLNHRIAKLAAIVLHVCDVGFIFGPFVSVGRFQKQIAWIYVSKYVHLIPVGASAHAIGSVIFRQVKSFFGKTPEFPI